MRRTFLLAIIFAAGTLVAGAPAARAQTDEPKWEVGGQLYGFDVANGSATQEAVPILCINPPCPTAVITTNGRSFEAGFGARVGRAVHRYVSVEAEVNYFPRERELTDDSFTGGRKLQGLFGVKVGKRYESFGLFAKARPGFVNFEQGDLEGRRDLVCPAVFPPPLGCVEPKGRTDFALDLGGVLELYPTRGTFIRFDAGDTILRSDAHAVPGKFRSSTGVVIDTTVGLPAETTHNFQGGVGFGFRF